MAKRIEFGTALLAWQAGYEGFDYWEDAMEAALRIGLHAIDFTNIEKQ